MTRTILSALRPGLITLAVLAATQASAAPSVQVTTVLPQQTRFTIPVQGYGSLSASPARRRTVALAWAGSVRALAVQPGQAVKRGAPLLTVAPDPAARAAWQRARHARDAARTALRQSERLHADGLATGADLARARQALHDAEAELRAQQRLGGAAPQTILHAPIAGVVSALPLAVGARFAPGTTLATLAPAGAAGEVRLAVTPQAAVRLKPGQPAKLHSVFGDTAFDATVRTVGAAVDPASGLVTVWLQPTGKLDLPTGSAVTGTIEVPGPRAWSVPRGAVVGARGQRAVFQIAQGKARRVPVHVVVRQPDRLGVQGALVAARPVVVTGAYELHDGMAVRRRP